MILTEKRATKYAYEMGVDKATNGANLTNCHFGIFSSPENTKAWEEGVRDGDSLNNSEKVSSDQT